MPHITLCRLQFLAIKIKKRKNEINDINIRRGIRKIDITWYWVNFSFSRYNMWIQFDTLCDIDLDKNTFKSIKKHIIFYSILQKFLFPFFFLPSFLLLYFIKRKQKNIVDESNKNKLIMCIIPTRTAIVLQTHPPIENVFIPFLLLNIIILINLNPLNKIRK